MIFISIKELFDTNRPPLFMILIVFLVFIIAFAASRNALLNSC